MFNQTPFWFILFLCILNMPWITLRGTKGEYVEVLIYTGRKHTVAISQVSHLLASGFSHGNANHRAVKASLWVHFESLTVNQVSQGSAWWHRSVCGCVCVCVCVCVCADVGIWICPLIRFILKSNVSHWFSCNVIIGYWVASCSFLISIFIYIYITFST